VAEFRTRTQISRSSPLVGDVRGRGLLLALELVANKETNERSPEHADLIASLRC
jgi:4-aminobutyrate aminotransferase-like enzyme